jgi:hypothetical protein
MHSRWSSINRLHKFGRHTLTPGLYTSTSSLLISGGTLYLNGKGVYIFQINSELDVTGASVVLEGGAQAADIFWQVGSSAILTTVPAFKGNILAYTSITMTAHTKLNGRALALNGNVTLISDTVTLP